MIEIVTNLRAPVVRTRNEAAALRRTVLECARRYGWKVWVLPSPSVGNWEAHNGQSWWTSAMTAFSGDRAYQSAARKAEHWSGAYKTAMERAERWTQPPKTGGAA